jgi:hypothetical protein
MCEQRSASATFRSAGAAITFGEPADYKHSVPPGLLLTLKNFVRKQELADLHAVVFFS